MYSTTRDAAVIAWTGIPRTGVQWGLGGLVLLLRMLFHVRTSNNACFQFLVTKVWHLLELDTFCKTGNQIVAQKGTELQCVSTLKIAPPPLNENWFEPPKQKPDFKSVC